MLGLAKLREYVPLVPPICEPAVPEKAKPVPAPIDEVATFANVFALEK